MVITRLTPIRRAVALAAAALLATLSAACGGTTASPAADGAYNFHPNVSLQPAPGSSSTATAAARFVPGQIIVKLRSSSGSGVLQSVGGQVMGSVHGGAQLVKVAGGDADQVASDLSRQGEVEFAEPNYLYHTSLTPTNSGYINQRNYLTLIKLPQAWNLTTGSDTVVTAVVDTGVDLTHPDLRPNIVAGYNVLSKGYTPPMDDNGHGTHVCGIVAATIDGKAAGSVVGVAPHTKVMPIKALDAMGNGNTADIAAGIQWAVDHGAKVINLSLGGGGNSRLLALAIHYAIAHKVTVLAAMGNGDDNGGPGRNLLRYPAAYDGVIAVGALSGNERAAFSDWGSWISVSAPGVDIYSTAPTYHVPLNDEAPDFRIGHGYLQGTSMATPVVSGIVALMLSRQPYLTPAAVKQKLESTATHPVGGSRDDKVGYGLVNAFLALN